MALAFGVVLVASTRTLASGATPKSNASDKATSTIERADKKTQESDERPIEPAALGATEETQEKQVKYSRKGLEIKGRDGNYTTRINWRSQLRYSYPFDAAPRNSEGFDKEEVRDFGFRRARFKAKGAVFRPWIQYSIEHDLVNNRLLTADLTIGRLEWLQFKFGQWKANYNRERVDSSGKQQFAERSIVNRTFTVDRQKGAMLTGRLMKGTRGDSRYYAGIFAGTGRGISSRDENAGRPLLMARYQWNFLKRDLEFSQSDLEYHEQPAASLSFATLSNRSRYTRFSGSGGGQLQGFQPGELGQYSIRQYLEETALKYRGFSFQHELHWKRIIDNKNLATTHLRGSYAQAGYFFHHLAPRVPKQLETAFRYAFVDHNTSAPNDLLHEFAFAVNWFFEGHSNKLTFEVSRLRLNQTGKPDLSDTRYRTQWDVSF